MTTRLEFVGVSQAEGANVALLCRRFGISRKTGYKWVGRYKAGGGERLADDVEKRVVDLRRWHPARGGRKLVARLLDLGVAGVPAASTVTAVLRRHGLLHPAECWARPAPVRFEHAAPSPLSPNTRHP